MKTQSTKMQDHQISLNRLFVTRSLGGVVVFLLIASLIGQLLKLSFGYKTLKGFIPFFNLNAEQNVPTFFSALLIVFAALLLLLIGTLDKTLKKPDAFKWFFLSSIFLFMSFDELSSFHERFTSMFRGVLGKENLGIFYYAWVLPAIVIVSILGLFFLKFLLRLPPKTKSTIFLSAGIYFSGALGMEMVGGAYAEKHGLQNLPYILMSSVEECLEMLGMIIFIHALLGYISYSYQDVIVRFKT